MENSKEISLKDRQLRILDIMKDVDSFCRENNIPYTLSSGTLLGAVRHGGFIPWDDDADMFMLREDFDRFAKIFKSDKYKLHNTTYSPGDEYLAGYIKIVDTSAYTLNKRGGKEPGLFVDIFPLDRVPEDTEKQHDYMHNIMSLYNRLYHRQRTDFVSIIKSYRHSLKWWKDRMIAATHDGACANSSLVAHIVGTTNYRTIINRDRFSSLTDIVFEGYPFRGFSDTHSYLEMVYGADYMTPRKWSHDLKVYSE